MISNNIKMKSNINPINKYQNISVIPIQNVMPKNILVQIQFLKNNHSRDQANKILKIDQNMTNNTRIENITSNKIF